MTRMRFFFIIMSVLIQISYCQNVKNGKELLDIYGSILVDSAGYIIPVKVQIEDSIIRDSMEVVVMAGVFCCDSIHVDSCKIETIFYRRMEDEYLNRTAATSPFMEKINQKVSQLLNGAYMLFSQNLPNVSNDYPKRNYYKHYFRFFINYKERID